MSDNKKGKAKSQNLPRARRGKRAPRKTSNTVGIAQAKVSRNTTRMSLGDAKSYGGGSKAIIHKTFGPGLEVKGMQYCVNVTTTASDSQLFTSGTASVTSINEVDLSPDALNGRLLALANLYARYRFTDVVWEYEPVCAATQSGGFVLAYASDPLVNNSTGVTYGALQQFQPSVCAPFRADKAVTLRMQYRGDDCWFTATDAATNAALRQCVQGTLFGAPSSSSIGAVNMGLIKIHYTVQFFSPVSTIGLTLRTEEEKKYLQECLKVYRAKQMELKESKESVQPVSIDRQSGYRAPPSSPANMSSASSSSTSSGVISSSQTKGWF